MQLFTASYTAWRPELGAPVVTSLMLPLERFGAAKIARALQAIALERRADRLVLCFFEVSAENCHRSIAADWLIAATKEVVDELL